MYRTEVVLQKTRTEIDLICTEVMYRNCPPLCTETVMYRCTFFIFYLCSSSKHLAVRYCSITELAPLLDEDEDTMKVLSM